MFEGIGRIGQYLQMQNLKYEAKYKMRTGRNLQDDLKAAGASTLTASGTKKTKNDTTDSTKLAIIKSKLRKGQELSASDLRYLKEHDSDLYQKAKQTQDIREELRQALKHANTRQEAMQAVAEAQAKVAASAVQNAKNGGTVNMSGAMSAGTADAASFSVDTAADIGTASAPSAEGTAETAGAAATGEACPAAAAETNGSAAAGAETETSASLPEADPGAGSGDKGLTADEKASPAQGNKASAGLADQASSSKKSDDLFDNVLLFELQAILDEWKTFVHSKDYAELPQDVVSGGKQEAAGRQPYRAQDAWKAADAYLQSGRLLEDPASLLADAADDVSSADD
jgi:hypothetical protein